MNKQETKNIWEKGWDIFPTIAMLGLLLLTGGLLNIFVIARNNGLMPVYADSSWDYPGNDKHFITLNKSEIREFSLVDKYYVFGCIVSIGDLIIYFSAVLIFTKLSFGIMAIIKRKQKNVRKRCRTRK